MRLSSAILALMLISSTAHAEGWHGSAAAGGDFAFIPEATGFGFVLFEAYGQDKVGEGDVRLYYNTEESKEGVQALNAKRAPDFRKFYE